MINSQNPKWTVGGGMGNKPKSLAWLDIFLGWQDVQDST